MEFFDGDAEGMNLSLIAFLASIDDDTLFFLNMSTLY